MRQSTKGCALEVSRPAADCVFGRREAQAYGFACRLKLQLAICPCSASCEIGRTHPKCTTQSSGLSIVCVLLVACRASRRSRLAYARGKLSGWRTHALLAVARSGCWRFSCGPMCHGVRAGPCPCAGADTQPGLAQFTSIRHVWDLNLYSGVCSGQDDSEGAS